MRTKFLILFLSGCLCGNLVYAQTISGGLDSLLRKTLDSMKLVVNSKSLSATIQFDDTTGWAYATGISSQIPLENVTPNHAYLIGSVTKTMTSACILQLVDKEVLSLEDTIGKWLPAMPYINPGITIRQLLRHQSGLYDALSHPNAQPTLLANTDSVWDAKDFLTTFMQPPVFQPGASWSYSNTNYFLLGMIIKAASGNDYYTEMRNRFFGPLGMDRTVIPAFETIMAPVAHVWLDINGDGVTDDAHNFYMNYLSLNSVAGAAGGYFSTAKETSKWMRTYMRGDLLSPAIMAEAKTTVPSPGLPGSTYGLGLSEKTFAGYQGWGHGGDLAYCASSWYFPAKDLSITVFCNDADLISWDLVPVVSALLKAANQAGNITDISSSHTVNPLVKVYPNPFSQSLSVKIMFPSKVQTLTLTLCNSMGQTIREVQKNNVDAGVFEYQWENLADLPQGIYIARVIADGNEIRNIKVVK